VSATSPIPRSATLTAAREQLELAMLDVWLAYVAVGGSQPFLTLDAWLAGTREMTDHEYDLVVQGLNDQFSERGFDHPLSYSDEPVGP
jgi:hypothetical protein